MGLSSAGIGSNLDVNSIVSQLMSVEQRPLTLLNMKEASYQAKLTAFGSVSGALGAFQSAVASLNSPSRFQAFSASSTESGIISASAGGQAVAGSYSLNVSRLAQAQTLASAGQVSTTAAIGAGAASTLTFQFGTISGGTFISSANKLAASVAASGIAANSLSINGTTIATSGTTNSAKELAAQINLQTSTTGVSATAAATDSGTLGAFATTSGAATYTLNVGGVNIITNAAIGTTAANIDTAVGSASAALTTAGITFTGTAAAGTLKFAKADGANIAIQESGAGAAGGFASTIGAGTTKTFTSAVSLNSANAVTISGTNPAAAGFSAGTLTNGIYSGASFIQDAAQVSGSVTLDGTNNSLQGIRDAINKANIGVTATIVSDGSASPNHLVLTSTKTGAMSSMKIAVSGDSALQNLLAYDPANVTGQKLTESSAGRNTELTVNGIAVSSATKSITDAIEGVSLNVLKTGSTTLNVARDTASVTAAVNGFVKSFNDLNGTLSKLTAYNATTKQAGLLIGDPTVRSIQTGIRRTLSTSISELSGNGLKSLPDIGVTFQKDGTLAVDTSKLQNAISNNFADIGALFAAMGKTTDSLVSLTGSTAATKPGNYPINLTTASTLGSQIGNADLNAAATVISASTALNVTVDGTTALVALSAGSYSASQLAAMLQSAINGTAAFTSMSSAVKVSIDGNGFLNIQSSRYGSASNVSLADGSGTSAATLIGAAPTSAAGADVAGSINGITASGAGQTLTGAAGSVTEGLKLLMGGTTIGNRGTINFSQGYAQQLSLQMDGFLGSSGMISGRTTGINSSIKDIGKSRDAVNLRLAAVEKRYRAQFTALDTMISSMSKTSSFLTQQLANLSSLSNGE